MKIEELPREDSNAGTRPEDALSQQLRFWRRSLEKHFWAIALMTLLVGAIAAIVVFWIMNFGSHEVFDERMRQTVEGNTSDRLRRDLLLTCIEIGLQNPIIGVSPQQLPVEIGRRLSVLYHDSYLDSHNVYAHILGGSGVICLGALLAFGWSIYAWKPHDGRSIEGQDDPLYDARRLMRMLVVLWAVRGIFTREILYNPSFNIVLGLCIGFCMLAEVERQSKKRSDRPAGNVLNPSPAGQPR